ncbi:MAG: hypothetical protein H7Z16_14350 [Pyrinomonadaceae bacterium]|nr:hypothetical protein [Pyrinomonadaceae bacterium]
MRNAIRILILSLMVMGLASVASAHRYHTSVTRIEHNAEESLVEITVQTFADDIEAALSKRTGAGGVRLDSSAKTNALLLDYLRNVIQLKTGDAGLELQWIGMELKGHSVWFFLQAKAPEGLSRLTLSNRLLFELFADQVNIVNVVKPGKRASLVFKRGDTVKSMP